MEDIKLTLSVADYIELLNEQLKLYDARIVGEVTQVKIWSSGHVYFTLKDKDAGAVMDCVLWRGVYELYGIKLEVGMEVILSGQANIYAPSGRLSFIAKSVELVGEGALKKAYDALKMKLAKEGLFAEERKRLIPQFPRKVGIITSKQGAVIHDFMNNLNRHGFQITLIDTKVEGPESLPDLYRAIRTMKQRELDVIVVMRGGGSLQSLAAFDSEKLVREITSSPTPVIAAIGHHEDTPLSALVADVMVSTPTAAANLVNSSWEKGLQAVTIDYQKIMFAYKQILIEVTSALEAKHRTILDKFDRVIHAFSYVTANIPSYLSHISKAISSISDTITRDTQHIMTHMSDAIAEQRTELKTVNNEKIRRSFLYGIKQMDEAVSAKERLVNVYNPMRQLALGYTIVRDTEGRLVKSIKDVTIGERLSLLTEDGSIHSVVENIIAKKTHE